MFLNLVERGAIIAILMTGMETYKLTLGSVEDERKTNSGTVIMFPRKY